MKIFWTITAKWHLFAIHDYISQHSPEYAKRVVDRLTRRSQQIAKCDTIGILAVIHWSQNFCQE